jgi:uncharacterized lipoprotein
MLQGLILLLVCTHFVLQGCVPLVAAGAGAAAGVGAASYVGGEMKTTYAAPFDRAWDATMLALRDTELRILDTQKDDIKGTIKAARSDGTNVTVGLEQAGPGTTRVGVRVGTFGDEDASKIIHNRIASRLGTRAS